MLIKDDILENDLSMCGRVPKSIRFCLFFIANKLAFMSP